MVFHSLSQALERCRGCARASSRAGRAHRRDAPAALLRRGAAAAAAPARAAALWRDEAHVEASRALYVAKFALADADARRRARLRVAAGRVLPVARRRRRRGGGAARSGARPGCGCCPAAYLGRDDRTGNPGAGYIRVALVAGRRGRRGLTAIRATLGAPQSTKGSDRHGPRARSKRRSPLLDSDTEEALRRRGAELARPRADRRRRARLGAALDLLARRSEPVQRHRRGAAQRAGAVRRLDRRSAAPRARLGRLRRCRSRSRSGGCGWCCTPARAGALRRRSPCRWRCSRAAVFAATHVPLAGWAHAYGLGGLLGDATLGALLGALPFGLGCALPLASSALGRGASRSSPATRSA